MPSAPDPLQLAEKLHNQGEDFALLYSGLRTSYSGEHTLLAHGTLETVTADTLTEFSQYRQGQWFGWLGYGLRRSIEELPADAPSIIDVPPLHMTRFEHVEQFDALTQPEVTDTENTPSGITSLHSNMAKEEYLQKVSDTIERIHAGAFYQANITRKFYGTLTNTTSPAAIFRHLCAISPAPYAAWLRFGNVHIVSSSPELFLKITPEGHMVTRPIKGSAPASSPAQALACSTKDQAENLMITDLMRNDFSRTALPGSVKAGKLFEIDSFSTIHHMSSTVEATRDPQHSLLNTIETCFPPGSMTGAPKIAAMKWCSQMEQIERGVYSGALGWVGPDACELSVVIRTLIIQGNRFEFQVGGGIVADSDPETEWRETMTKARGIAGALGIDNTELYQL